MTIAWCLYYFYLKTLHYRHCWSKQYAGRVSYELRNRPRSPKSLVVKRWNANPKVWGSIPRGDSEFFLYPMLVTRRKKTFLILHRAQNLPSLLFLSSNKFYVYIWIIKVVWLLTTRIWVVFSIPARRPWCSNSFPFDYSGFRQKNSDW